MALDGEDWLLMLALLVLFGDVGDVVVVVGIYRMIIIVIPVGGI